MLKQAFYFCSYPPGILLSLLPAPQQAILNFVEAVELHALYGIQMKTDFDDDEMTTEKEFDEEESKVLDSLSNLDDEEETDASFDDEYDDENTDIFEEIEESDDTDED